MRVLFCQTTPYPPEETGGALSNTHALCETLHGHWTLACEDEDIEVARQQKIDENRDLFFNMLLRCPIAPSFASLS